MNSGSALRPRDWMTAISVGLASSLVGQLLPPFHLLTHEFAQAYSIVGGIVVFFTGRSLARRFPEQPNHACTLTLALGIVQALTAFASHTAINEFMHACRMRPAAATFWITCLPLIALAAVLGTAIGKRSIKVAVALLATVIGIDAIHVWMQVRTGSMGTSIGCLTLGPLLSFDQRIGMEITTAQLAQRVWLAGVAIVAWQLTSWRRSGRRWPALGTLLFLFVFGVASITLGPTIGVGWSRSALYSRLDGIHETDHFILRYDSRGFFDARVAAIAREIEWEWHRLTTSWRLDVPSKVEIRLIEELPHGLAGADWINLPRYASAKTIRHELVHVLHNEFPSHVALGFLRGHGEGLAWAWQDDLMLVPEAHESQASALSAGLLPEAPDFMGATGFWSTHEKNAYRAAGSFVGWLILEFGMERFMELQRTLDYRATYDLGLDALSARWHSFLQSIPLSGSTVAAAQDRYEPQLAPAYVDRRCPKLGPREEPAHRRARRMWSAGNHELALETYLKLFDETRNPRHLVSAAACLQQQKRHDEALELLAQLADATDIGHRSKLTASRIHSFFVLRDWDALYAAFDERRQLDPQPTIYRQLTEECMRDTELRSGVVSFLEAPRTPESRDSLRMLALRHPDRECVQYLHATHTLTVPISRSMVTFGRFTRDRVALAMDGVGRFPQACDSLGVNLGHVIDKAIKSKEWQIATDVAELVTDHCTDPQMIRHAQRALERVTWERPEPRSGFGAR